MMQKLNKKAKIDGSKRASDSQSSRVVVMVAIGGRRISRTSKVSAIANTPSQKASKRELGLGCATLTSSPNLALHGGLVWLAAELRLCQMAGSELE
jgi:hypothetical protein